MKLRTALILVLLNACHRDLDVEPADTAVPTDTEFADAAVTPDDSVDTMLPDTGSAEETPADTAETSDVVVDSSPLDSGSDACASATCTTPPAATCASTTTRRTYASIGTCAGGSCSYAHTDAPCPPDQICSAGVCEHRSCAGGLSCAGGISCCENKALPGGTFLMGRGGSGPEVDVCTSWASGTCGTEEQPEHSATVAPFGLDTFEVTVGRFRKFVAAYPGSKPAAGAGAHVLISGSGWQAAWNAELPATATDLIAGLKCYAGMEAWTDTPTTNETLPVDCVSWYVAFAFCAWDGGRLPTEAEWEYAAAGGEEDRVLPWGLTAPNPTLANGGCFPACSGAKLLPVGSKPLGASRWGQFDLAGNVLEWTLDARGAFTSTSKTNFANLSGTMRVQRGSNNQLAAGTLRAAARGWAAAPSANDPTSGFRCAH